MLKLLILATLLALLGRMATDLWRAWLRGHSGAASNASVPGAPTAELVPCSRCGVHAPAAPGLDPRNFVCQSCRASRR